MKSHKAAKHGINVVWFSCDQDNCNFKAKSAREIKRHQIIFTSSTSFGTSAIHATSWPNKQATSNDIKNIFTTSTSFGTSAIHANTKQSKQAT
ncbi:hypothetical protein TrLO_g11649 [Triparma laevis f. longispina]|uniref:Uncharacterized protein n=1 Tax=Triparma laevis f. longispina TaxID=1714387 RepID=A0A9W7CG78_9STRA|nr:hypothetical protein TrLO_g11649 [Triparma laevis f. longispina]